jgi:hypothetical protein
MNISDICISVTTFEEHTNCEAASHCKVILGEISSMHTWLGFLKTERRKETI